jgi:NAD(P)-dependent dehydrogenase (short-subunit alcohol dehydrogenase family)
MKIVITGTSSGIGNFLARHFASAGHDVCGMARSPQTEPFLTVKADVTNPRELTAAASLVQQRWGKLDVLICCASTQGPISLAMETDPRVWLDGITHNLGGTFNTIHAFFPLLLQHEIPVGKVFCFSGGGATKARPCFSSYACAKTAIVRLVETLAQEWAEKHLEINAIAPGAVNTKMTREVLALGPERAGPEEYQSALKTQQQAPHEVYARVAGCLESLIHHPGVTGKLISAVWDDWLDPKKLTGPFYYLRRTVPEGQ